MYTWQQTLSISFLRGLQKPSLHFSLSVEQHQAPRIDLCCQSLAGVGKQMALSGEQVGPGLSHPRFVLRNAVGTQGHFWQE